MNSNGPIRTPETDRECPPDAEDTVLIVDDEPHLAGMYAAMLEDRYTVRTATSGEAALERLSASIDVVLLDRRMPNLSGDSVLERIRARGENCLVAMVTSVEPDVGIAEMAFDAYMVKPVRQQDLRELVANLLLRAQYSSEVRQLFAVASKLAALESRHDAAELANTDEYEQLCERKERLEAAAQQRIEELSDQGDSGLVFRDVLGQAGT